MSQSHREPHLPRQIVSGNFKFFPGTVCRVFLNDIPVFQGFEGNGFSHNGGINHFLVPGENELLLEILAAPAPIDGRLAYEPDPRPQMAGKDLNQTVEASVFKERIDAAGNRTGEIEIIYQTMFPDLWQHVDEGRRQLPYMHVARFDPGVDVPELTYLGAPFSEVPCEGTPDLHDAVRELHDAFSARDARRLAQLMALQMEEYDRAHHGRAGATRPEQRQAIDELVAEDIVVAPLDWAQMHFHARAHGKLVHVERLDRNPVIDVRTIGKPQGHMSDPVFTHHDGRWQLM